MSEKLETSKSAGAHFQLSQLAGQWEGITKTWFDPAKVEDESPVSGTMKLILDGRFILHEYTGSFAGKPITGMAIYGYNLDTEQFQCAWIDSFHNGSALMFQQGQKGEKDMSVVGRYAYVTPEIEQHWGWRTHIEIVNDREVHIIAYNISPEGEEAKATETIYKKVS